MSDGLQWRKSRRCSGGDCLEVAALPDGGVAVRHSRFPKGPVIHYTQAEWAAFIGGAKDGEFDDLTG